MSHREPQPGERIYTADPDFPMEVREVVECCDGRWRVLDQYGDERVVEPWGSDEWMELQGDF
jgi:hypothetical protein